MGLPYGEEIMIVGRTMWTDGQTDRITITKTVQRIASHGKNGAKSIINSKVLRKMVNINSQCVRRLITARFKLSTSKHACLKPCKQRVNGYARYPMLRKISR